jgi:5-methylcytosine-specific restriction endonuclease McrA
MSLHHQRKPLNASRIRARKRTLAVRDGAWCTYCGRLFADLRQATIDHVVPVSLFPTWRLEHTVLACHPCNQAKADRLPLTLAVVLTAWSRSADASADCTPPVGRLTRADWTTLARLAHTAESAHWTAARSGSESGAGVMVRALRSVDSPRRSARSDLRGTGAGWDSTRDDVLGEAA